jgi:hypothetical protein
MSEGTRSKGTRIYKHAAVVPWVNPWTALAPGASPAAAYKEVVCPLSVSKPKRFETQEWDASCLTDAGEQPTQEKKPGGFTFTAKQADGADGGTEILKTAADATTLAMWVILYKDGRAFIIQGVLIPEAEGEAANQLTDEVKHEYRVRGSEIGEWSAAA